MNQTKEVKICLNMIVKNEEHVINRCFNNIKHMFDVMVISDTGSTDKTMETIKKWANDNNRPCELVQRPWVNFGSNRTEALRIAEAFIEKQDPEKKYIWYIMFMDADNEAYADDGKSEFPFDKKALDTSCDSFRTTMKCQYLVYDYVWFVKYNPQRKWKWYCPCHEYVSVEDKFDPKYGKLMNGFVNSGRDGARNKDPIKYLRDALLFEEALKNKDDAHYKRYLYYAGQSYRDARKPKESESFYIQRGFMDGWPEERYLSLVEAAKSRINRGKADMKTFNLLYKAIEIKPDRLEAVHLLVFHHRINQQYKMGWYIGKNFMDTPFPKDDLLFIDRPIHEWKLLDEIGVCAIESGIPEAKTQSKYIFSRILLNPTLQADEIPRIRKNLFLAENANVRGTVAILCNADSKVGYWDGDSVLSGIAGSEEAVINIAEQFAKKGYVVTVYANPNPESKYTRYTSNPLYRPFAEYVQYTRKFNFTIAWRRSDFSLCKKFSEKVFYWPHDACNRSILSNDLSGIFWLSETQKKQYLNISPNLGFVPSIICGNGIDINHFKHPQSYKNPLSCIYASNYARGLSHLINMWDDIHSQFPDATLDIYYGWETWGLLQPEQLEELKNKIESLKGKGVHEHGKVGHLQLANAFQNSSIWTYPCTMFETYCITAIKAQASGCLPVVTNHSALAETVHPNAPRCDTIGDYKNLLLTTMKEIKEGRHQNREVYIEFSKFKTWGQACDNMLLLDNKISK